MGGAMSENKVGTDGQTAKDKDKPQGTGSQLTGKVDSKVVLYTVTPEQMEATLKRLGGGGDLEELRAKPLHLLKKAVDSTLFEDVVLLMTVLRGEIAKGNLAAIKLLIELVERYAKYGSIEPGKMESFADLLIASLKADEAAAAVVVVDAADGARVVVSVG
jgi:hypothetical protein